MHYGTKIKVIISIEKIQTSPSIEKNKEKALLLEDAKSAIMQDNLVKELISEFGIFGLAGILSYIKIAANCLRKLKLKMHTTHANIAMTVIVAVAPEILLRGGGYFSVSLLLMLASIRYLTKSSKSNVLSNY